MFFPGVCCAWRFSSHRGASHFFTDFDDAVEDRELPVDCSILVSIPFVEWGAGNMDWEEVPCALMKRVLEEWLPISSALA
jgi:hypothetical protein